VCGSQPEDQKDAIIVTSQNCTEIICSKTLTVPSNNEACFGLTRALARKYPLTGERAELRHPGNGLKTTMLEETLNFALHSRFPLVLEIGRQSLVEIPWDVPELRPQVST